MKTTSTQKLLLLLFLSLFISCDSEEDPEEPKMPEVATVTNESEAAVTHTSVEITGSISEAETELLSYGVVWAEAANPTLEDNVALPGENSAQATAKNRNTRQAQNDNFTVRITDLNPGKTYYFRTFATNEAGTAYGEQISLTTPGLAETKWEITFQHEENSSWLAHVTFYEDGTAFYTEPDHPGEFDMWGEWSMDGNILTYDMMPEDDGESYILTGEINENQMAGTYTFLTPDGMTERPWIGTLLSSEVE